MDFDNLEHLGLAWDVIEDGLHEITILAEANLLDFSISRLVDDICVEKRRYGSLRELIDKELYDLDYAELVSLNDIAPDRLVELGIPEEQLEEVTRSGRQQREGRRAEAGTAGQESGLPHVEGEVIGPERMEAPEDAALPETEGEPGGQAGAGGKDIFPETVEIEGGQVITEETERVYRGELQDGTVPRKLHPGTELQNFRITDDTLERV